MTDYKAFVIKRLTAGGGRGGRSALARHLGCQPAFVSQVLGGTTQFSLEQALKVSRFLALDAAQTEYFLLLVQLARAGSADLTLYWQRQLSALRRAHQQIGKRLQLEDELSSEDQAIYYSVWHHAAVHVLTSVPAYQTAPAVAQRLGLTAAQTEQSLAFLTRSGLVERQADGRYTIGARRIHLGRGSPLLARHHANWRLRAMLAADRDHPDALHYSSVVTLARADAQRVKDLILDMLSVSEKILTDSREEEIYCLALDFFELG